MSDFGGGFEVVHRRFQPCLGQPVDLESLNPAAELTSDLRILRAPDRSGFASANSVLDSPDGGLAEFAHGVDP
ncbi:hypothetical protein [Lacisediminihabitans profunda]|uniref:Uncharacterized protein n=1 Tax=Lacisediminihabitans profunda TaxID=2594790 RepID=A0A5C8URU9_9MICO|nr:hypothetical protein [Lacisediminihabitans profunda]TXN31235.1 hypothetical protein FVP33_06595 [Lacisediminihabitans profunda]